MLFRNHILRQKKGKTNWFTVAYDNIGHEKNIHLGEPSVCQNVKPLSVCLIKNNEKNKRGT